MRIFKKNNEEHKKIVNKALDKKNKANDEEAIMTLSESEISQLRDFLNGDAEIEVIPDSIHALTEEEITTLKDIIPALLELLGKPVEEDEDVEDVEDEEEVEDEDEDIEDEEAEDDEEVKAEDEDTKVCPLCNNEFTEWGNDGYPVIDDIVCNECNQKEVIPARLAQVKLAKGNDDAGTDKADAGTGDTKENPEEKPEEKAEDEVPTKKVFVKKTLTKKAGDSKSRRINPNADLFKMKAKALDEKEPVIKQFDFHKRG